MSPILFRFCLFLDLSWTFWPSCEGITFIKSVLSLLNCKEVILLFRGSNLFKQMKTKRHCLKNSKDIFR